jgi:thioesterase domain-containing protein
MRFAIQRRISLGNGIANGQSQPDNQFAAHTRAASRHRARGYSGTLDLFCSGEWSSRSPHSPKLGWDALVRRLRVHPVFCGHSAVMSDAAAVQLIAETLKEYL